MISFYDVLSFNFVKDNNDSYEYQSVSMEKILKNELVLKMRLLEFGDQVNKYISYKDGNDLIEDLCN